VHLNGTEVKINAKIENLEGWSAHADRDGLLAFAEACLQKTDGHDVSIKTKTIFTAIGEPSAERFLAQRIHDYLGATAVVPDFGQTWKITKDSVELTQS